MRKKITKAQRKIKTIHLDNIIKSARTIDVINYFIKKMKIRNIYFIIGSDNLIQFHKWKSWKKIVKLVKIIVFSRKGYDRKGLKSTVAKKFKNRIIFIKSKPISISSTQLKKADKIEHLMAIIDIKNNIEKILDDNKAQNITCIDLKNKSYIADYMVIASGTSSRHLQALSEILVTQLKKLGIDNCRIEGKDSKDWKLVDTQDVIVHIFHPEKESFMI